MKKRVSQVSKQICVQRNNVIAAKVVYLRLFLNILNIWPEDSDMAADDTGPHTTQGPHTKPWFLYCFHKVHKVRQNTRQETNSPDEEWCIAVTCRKREGGRERYRQGRRGNRGAYTLLVSQTLRQQTTPCVLCMCVCVCVCLCTCVCMGQRSLMHVCERPCTLQLLPVNVH